MRLPELVNPAIYPLDPNHPDVGFATINRFLLALVGGLTDSAVSIDDLRLVAQMLTQLSSDYLNALQGSLTDRQQLNQRVATLETTVASLLARLTAVEQKPAVRNVAVAAPVNLGLLSIGTRDITLQWDRTLPDTNYDPEYWPSPGLLGSVSLVTKARTTTTVVVTVKSTALIAAGGSLGAIAVRTT